MALLALLAWVASPLCAQTKPPGKAAQESKQPAKGPSAAKPSAKAAPKAKPPAKAGAAAAAPERAARRDPFNPLVGHNRPGGELAEHLPPGKAGLIVASLRVDGLVRGPNGMIAVVSNPQQRVYFLHEGDQLYDGRVERITLDMVAFHEVGKDAFGKPVDRQVVKRLYGSPGEQR
jgi:type IV pilus assembly protein PilP